MVNNVESKVSGAGLTASRVNITEHFGGIPLNNWGLVDMAIEALKAGVVDVGKHREYIELRRTLVKQGLPISSNNYQFWPLVMPEGDCRPWLLRLLTGLNYRQSNDATEPVDNGVVINVRPQLTPLYDVYNRYLLSFQGPHASVFEESAAVTLRIPRVLKGISISVEFSPEGQIFDLDGNQILYQLNMIGDYVAKHSGLIDKTGSGLAADLAEPVILATIDDINLSGHFCGFKPPVLRFDLQRLVNIDGTVRQLPLLGFSTITIAQGLATTIAQGFMPEYTKVWYA